MATSQNSKNIKASPEKIYRAFTDPEALVVWQAPGQMTAKIHNFDLRIGRGYEMSLFYPLSEKEAQGKTSEREDRFTAKFIELTPYNKIVEAITFESLDPALSEEMLMEVTLDPIETGTRVNITFMNIPEGISPADNEEGTRSSLNKLASYVEVG